MRLRLALALSPALAAIALVALGCEPAAKDAAARSPMPEACVTLGTCCETLPEPDHSTCFVERDGAASSDTGSVPCSRALATYRGRGFCGGKTELGQRLAPGCAVLWACCATVVDEGERAACDVDLAAFSASREGEEGCVAAHTDRVNAGLCEEAPPVPRGPSCQALVGCCASLASDARAACTQSADQLAARASAEDDCEASRVAYVQAGLCLENTPAVDLCLLTPPEEKACCVCPTGKTCTPNGCYNGYLCDADGCTCGKRPTSGPCAAK